MAAPQDVPKVEYAHSSGFNIAYQVFGSGPVDVILIPGFVSHIEYGWHEPSLARFLRRLSGFARVIAFDKRGMGMSDRADDDGTPSMAQRTADIAAVLSAAGSTSAALLAWSEGGAAAIAFARQRPELTAALMLMDTTARFTATDDYAIGVPRDVLETFIDVLESDWGTGVGWELYAPSLAEDDRTRSWWASYQRFSATPGAVASSLRMHLDVDVRSVLPYLKIPTLVFHRSQDMLIPVECGRYLAEHISGALYLEQASEDHMYWVGNQTETLEAIRLLLASTAQGGSLQSQRQPNRRSRTGWESLTRAELDVARLVATGMTNIEIAARLTLSPRTVQSHLTHIMGKLGTSRRAEVAVMATQHAFD